MGKSKKPLRITMIVLSVIVLAVLIFGGVLFAKFKQSEASQNAKLNNQKTFNLSSSKDINNKPITNDIFKGHKLTMINIWATTCSPCIKELPDLEELSKEIKAEDVQLIGVISDGASELQASKDIISKQGVTFTNVIPDKTLEKFLKDSIVGTPTTIFVDGNGNLVGKSILGSKKKDSYKNEVKELLTKVK